MARTAAKKKCTLTPPLKGFSASCRSRKSDGLSGSGQNIVKRLVTASRNPSSWPFHLFCSIPRWHMMTWCHVKMPHLNPTILQVQVGRATICTLLGSKTSVHGPNCFRDLLKALHEFLLVPEGHEVKCRMDQKSMTPVKKDKFPAHF